MRQTTFAVLFFVWANITWGQMFYYQPFGEFFPAGWSANSGRVVMNDQAVSGGYNPPPASAGYNMRMDDCLPTGETVQATVSGVISTVGRTGIRVGFGRRRSNAHETPVAFAWSSDGVTWNTISTDVADIAPSSWSAVFFDLPASAENVANLRFRFSYVTQENRNCTAPPNFRIDDFAVGENFSLPMELLYFDAKVVGTRTQLTWATASEQNSARFEVERSSEGTLFDAIGGLPAAVNSLKERPYEFSDEQPLPGANYYRLRMVDADGSFSYSPIRQVHVRFKEDPWQIFPSPAHEILQVVCLNPSFADSEPVQWYVLDLLGRVRLQGNHPDGAAWSIPLHTLSAGQYVFRGISAGRQWVQTFLKE